MQLLYDQSNGIPDAVLRYGPNNSAVTGTDGAIVVSLPIPAEANRTLIPLTIEFDGDRSHLPATYTVGLPVTPPPFDWLLWVGFPLALVLAAAGAYLYGFKRWTLVPLHRRDSGSDEGAPGASAILVATPGAEPVESADGADGAAVAPDIPHYRTAAPDLEGLIATRLSLLFPNLPPGGDRIWRTGKPVDIVCVLTDDAGQPMSDAPLRLEWDGSHEVASLRTGIDGQCAASWSNGDPGAYLVTVHYFGDAPIFLFRSARNSDYVGPWSRIWKSWCPNPQMTSQTFGG